MTWQAIGLTIFCNTSIGTLLVLLYDLWLYETGRTMITDYCRANPWAAYLILMECCAGLMGLAVHLMAPVKI